MVKILQFEQKHPLPNKIFTDTVLFFAGEQLQGVFIHNIIYQHNPRLSGKTYKLYLLTIPLKESIGSLILGI